MKKILGAIALTALVATMAPAQAADADGGVLLPSLIAGRVARCTADQPGLFGQVVDVTPGASFTLTATDDNADLQDLDILFYKSITPCEADSDSVAEDTDHENVDGDEAGVVPPDATTAIVVLFAGANASFTYDEA